MSETPAPKDQSTTQSQSALPAMSAEKAPVPPMPAASNETAANATNADTPLPPVPDVAIRGHRWLSGLPGNFFVIAHGRHERLTLALRQIETKAELSTARVVMLSPTPSQASRFLVITGPFRSLERAQNFKVRQKLPESTDIQEVSTVLAISRAGPKVKP